ncbi:hypothetical protein HFP51_00335 [Parasphingopyxis sp. CP4]|uniref:hypothetical protein n=1 Tax=Parasphingopyxis sp. CP4 TaxID=2724527 RepID=UPI00159F72C1|nr:hypothetical protein [Parasphingopyxis sp. CP4]QLC20765.1 hypothetical protein HFP51_00335 [Parasphingopyxis sp. CP4]
MADNQEGISVGQADALRSARNHAHKALQHVTRAARANLVAEPDDSQSNVGWDSASNGFVSHPIGELRVGLGFSDFTLFVRHQSGVAEQFPLSGASDAEVAQWLDDQLVANGHSRASTVELPYALPDDAAAIEGYDADAIAASDFAGLADWFGATAASLMHITETYAAIDPGPSPVRCWPHHFDIATYIALESGDPETAKGIGVGLSPGDEGYDEPYLYINPWPHLDAASLPPAVAPGHWHSEGYVGLIATASEIGKREDLGTAIANFLEPGVDVAIKARMAT